MNPGFQRRLREARGFLVIAALCALAACATRAPLDQTGEAARYREHTRQYKPPGPPDDPWRPYIVEASRRFDVPERWIREVMRVESGGKAYRAGEPITSVVGAMGLMQVMPATYDELRLRYSLGEDPYEPHDNILAGAAYIREMYDVYGSPGFLAAYNAGPKRLDDYLNRNRALPDETRRYVAMIGPYIRDSVPERRSPAEDTVAMLPINIPPGPRRHYAMARRTTPTGAAAPRPPVQVAALPEEPRLTPPSPPSFAVASRKGFHLLPQAQAAEPVSFGRGAQGKDWGIQVGAYASRPAALAATSASKGAARGMLGGSQVSVESVRDGRQTLYRARLLGLSRDAAFDACAQLRRAGHACSALSPDAARRI